MQRGDIFWADLDPPLGRRPVVVVTRTSGLEFLTNVTIAPITSSIRDIPTEVALGTEDGLARESAASCDNLTTIPQSRLEGFPIGRVHMTKMYELDAAICFALGIPSRA